MQGVASLTYLIRIAFVRFFGFFVHWYRDGLHAWLYAYRQASSSLEEMVASRLMIHLLFRPLYGDYSIVGRIIGPIFRFGRLVIGVIGHILLVAFFGLIIVVWLLIPPLLITYAFGFLR